MKRKDKLSHRQKKILQFMEKYFRHNGFPPTIREIGEATDINSTSVVNYNLNKLVTLGYLERSATKSRGLRLVKKLNGQPADFTVRTGSAVKLPLAGQIVAGEPVEFLDQPSGDDVVEVTPYLLNGADPDEVFALKVQGESMIDAMISEGDIVILRKTNTARNGEMVAVWLNDRNETTLKYFYREQGGKIRLQPAHPTMDPIFVNSDVCNIQGRVVSVIRMLK